MSSQLCIVDDSADHRFLLQHLFSRDLPQYSVAFYPSGSTLLEALATRQTLPGLIVLDQHMPGLKGDQVLLYLKKHLLYKYIPVVMMSAGANPSEISTCYDAHANSFLEKPVDFEQLRQRIALLCQYWLGTNLHPYCK